MWVVQPAGWLICQFWWRACGMKPESIVLDVFSHIWCLQRVIIGSEFPFAHILLSQPRWIFYQACRSSGGTTFFKSTEYALLCISGISMHNEWSESGNDMCCTPQRCACYGAAARVLILLWQKHWIIILHQTAFFLALLFYEVSVILWGATLHPFYSFNSVCLSGCGRKKYWFISQILLH